jgi:sugar lactone lactonase YvrE
MTMTPRVLLEGLAIPESPRWHDGRLWFSNWGTRQIVAVDLDGSSEVVGEAPTGSAGGRTGSPTDACS